MNGQVRRRAAALTLLEVLAAAYPVRRARKFRTGWRCGEPTVVSRRLLKLLRQDEVVLPVLLQALPCLRLFRIENRVDLAVVFANKCLERLLSFLR